MKSVIGVFSADMLDQLFVLQFYGNLAIYYVQAFLLFLFVWLALVAFRQFVTTKIRALALRTSSKIDDTIVDAIAEMRWPAFVLIALAIGARCLVLPGIVQRVLGFLALITAAFYAIRALQKFIDVGFATYSKKYEGTDRAIDLSILKLLARIVKVILWFIVIILILQNVGYNVSALVTGLGIGGIALALVVQSILSDLFASFSLYFDRPFQVGDFISFGENSGTVKHIGLKSTRIKAVQGQEIIVSNKFLTESTVNNFRRMTKRNVTMNVNVAFDTSLEQLRIIPTLLHSTVEDHAIAEGGKAYFREMTDTGYRFVMFYSLPKRDYSLHMEVRNDLNYAIKEAFEKHHIHLAFPVEYLLTKDRASVVE